MMRTLFLVVFLNFVFAVFLNSSIGIENPEKLLSLEDIKSARKFYNKGLVEFRRRNFESAEDLFLISIKQCREFSDSWFMISKLNYRDKRYHSAYSNIQKAKEFFPLINRSLLSAKVDEMMVLKLRLKRVQNILDAEYNKLNCRSPKSEIQGYEIELSRLKDRIRRLGGVVKGEPETSPEYCFFAGNICLKLNRFQEAYKEYRDAVKCNRKYEPAWTNMLILLISQNNFKGAYKELQEAEKSGVVIEPRLKEIISKNLKTLRRKR